MFVNFLCMYENNEVFLQIFRFVVCVYSKPNSINSITTFDNKAWKQKQRTVLSLHKKSHFDFNTIFKIRWIIVRKSTWKVQTKSNCIYIYIQSWRLEEICKSVFLSRCMLQWFVFMLPHLPQSQRQTCLL